MNIGGIDALGGVPTITSPHTTRATFSTQIPWEDRHTYATGDYNLTATQATGIWGACAGQFKLATQPGGGAAAPPPTQMMMGVGD